MKTIKTFTKLLLSVMIMITSLSVNALTVKAEPTDGTAYALLNDGGDFIFFRSYEEYQNEENTTVTDINNQQYTGVVFTNVENTDTNAISIPWNSYKENIKKVQVAENSKVQPSSTAYWFSLCYSLNSVDLSGFDTSNVKNMAGMFECCNSLTSLDFKSFETSNVTNMSFMFSQCDNLCELDLSSFDTSNVTDMSAMFGMCSNLTTLNLSSFDTNSVIKMGSMFFLCNMLQEVVLGPDFTKWDRDAVLPTGNWTNGIITKTEDELCEEYPSNTSEWAGTWTRQTSPVDGEAYAVLTDDGDFIFFRSYEEYQNEENTTVTDINNQCYMGTVFTDVENTDIHSHFDLPWYNYRHEIETVSVADNTIIMPLSTALWFSGCINLQLFSATGIDTSNTINMGSMFSGCEALTSLDLHSFITTNVKDISGMFVDCCSLTSLDLSNFDTSKITSMYNLFYGCSSLVDLDLSSFNTSNVTSWGYMFHDCDMLQEVVLGQGFTIWDNDAALPSGNWTNGTIIRTAEELCEEYPNNASEWAGIWTKVSEVDPSSGVTYVVLTEEGDLIFVRSNKTYTNGETGTIIDINNKEFSGIIFVFDEKKYYGTTNLPWSNNKADIKRVYVADNTIISPENIRFWFQNCTRLEEFLSDGFNTKNVTYMSYVFGNCTSLQNADVSSFDTSNVINIAGMFSGCSSLQSLDLSNFNTSKITHMGHLFWQCTALKEVDLSSFDTSSVQDMEGMFFECSSLTELNLSNFRTGSVSNMSRIFYNCSSLVNLNISNFDIRCLTSLDSMFYGCSSLIALDLTSFDTKTIRTMNYMFQKCNSLKHVNLSSFDTSNSISMNGMFYDCNSLTELDLSNFNTSSLNSMDWMFYNCKSLTYLNICNFDTNNVTSMKDALYHCYSLCEITLGPKFKTWINEAYLPSGNWSNGLIVRGNKDLYNQYPTNAEDWAGIWRKCSFTLQENYKELIIGESFQQTVIVSPVNAFSDSFIWISGDEAIATVDDNGLVNGIAEGTTTIYVQSKNDNPISFSFNVRVIKDATYYGKAYAIYTTDDSLVFVRSQERYANNSYATITDIYGKEYTGRIYSNIENTGHSLAPWDVYSGNIKKVYVAEDTIVYPTSMSHWFYNCHEMIEFDPRGIDTSNVTDMNYLFWQCKSLKQLDLSIFDTCSVTDMSGMFMYCSALVELDLSNFDTSSVTNMTQMFAYCNSMISMDLSSFNTSNVTAMKNMFYCCNSLCSIKLGSSFTTWLSDGYLPDYTYWTNGQLMFSYWGLGSQYPLNATEWAGEWEKGIPVASIELKESYIRLIKGETTQLITDVLPVNATKKDLMWQSYDNNIVTVDNNGVITAISPGSTTVYVYAQDGSDVFAICTIDVCEFEFIEIRISDDGTAVGVFLNPLSYEEEIVEVTNVSGTIIQQPTCTEAGYILYEATISEDISLNNNAYYSSRTVEIVPTGHEWGEWKYDGESAKTHTHICANDNTHKETEPCTFDEGTTVDGVTTYTCKVCGGTYSVKEEGPVNPEVDGVIRVAGANRFGTSQAIASVYRLNNNVEKLDAVILANGDNFADALAGSYLAAEKNAPIIITRAGKEAEVNAYIRSILNKNGTIYVLGGTAAVPESCLNGLTGKGYDIKRLWGSNRYLTNLDILNHVGIKGDRILVATGNVFADSLSASATGLPMLLVRDDGLTDQQREFLSQNKGKEFIILGGNNAVKPIIESQLKSYGSVRRIMGANRAGTSIEIAKEFFPEAKQAVVAYSHNFPDGLCGGPLAHQINAPLILTRDNDADATASYLKSKGIKNGYVLGGTSVVSDALVRKLYAMRSSDKIIEF